MNQVRRIFFLFMFCGMSFLSAYGFSQEQKVTLNLKNSSVNAFFSEIFRQTGLRFIYNEDDLKGIGSLDVRAHEERVDHVLKRIFSGRNIDYSFEKGVIYVKKQTVPAYRQTMQQEVVRGKVLDENGEPMLGATVKVKGTSVGTVTGEDGTFELRIPGNATEVEVSYIGYKPVTMKIVRNAPMLIRMTKSLTEIGEVVVTGIFTQKADSYTGAVNTIKADALKKVGNQNILQSLKNIDPFF